MRFRLISREKTEKIIFEKFSLFFSKFSKFKILIPTVKLMPISRAGPHSCLKLIFIKFETIQKSAFSKKSISYYQKIIFIKSYFVLDFLKNCSQSRSLTKIEGKRDIPNRNMRFRFISREKTEKSIFQKF